ncbi:FAD-binding protein [Dinoroseobacter sp. PD6]|uniref:FAD-binding protein n=1 Tax=Dinoroseobacter sp. PD6 TaxID=3028384 RepID=UPI00237AE741|nr:FAD-binding protein [Dinoroseobacter sp. PD6]MDD9716929.1 FAD-binding protein [Dinoroseobacter sp. PD6]
MQTPGSEAELAEVIAGADAPLRIRGGGTRPIGKPVAGEVLSTAALSGIGLYEPGALTLVAQAGTPLAEVEAALAAERQRLPFEPMDHRGLLGSAGEPTLGGVVAGNVSGPRRIQAGACRDSLIGVRFVTGEGAVVKNGGRVMKNVTGYDLVKLMAGSHGTLGVLTEVSFKVLPQTETEATLTVTGLDDATAVAALSRALGAPYEVSGAAHLPHGADGPETHVRIEGFETSVTYRTGKLTELLGKFGPVRVEADPAASRSTWVAIRDVAAFHGTAGDVWRISVKPSDGPAVGAALGGDVIYDWGGGLVWAHVAPGRDVRGALAGLPGGFSGHATLIRAAEATRAAQPVFQPEPAPLAAISAGLRAKFDPKGILNPGLMA